MKATDRYAFPYPEPEDFADGSTQITNLAFAIDAELQARIDAYNDVLRPPTYIRGRSSTVNFSSSTQFGPITWNSDIYSSDTLNAASITTIKVPEPGIYHAGMFAWLTVVGAVTANSLRSFQLEFVDQRGDSLNDQVTMEWQQSTLEAVSGVAVTMHAVFPVYNPTANGVGLRGNLQHANTASQMQLQVGSYIWISRLGDLVT